MVDTVDSLRAEIRTLRDLLETAQHQMQCARDEANKADDEAMHWKTEVQRKVFEGGQNLYNLMWEWKRRAEKAEATLAGERVALENRAAADVIAERRRQVEAEGWTTEHDDRHTHCQLAEAAACYAWKTRHIGTAVPTTWPWDKKWWKPSHDKRRNLVKAGALILAEIERLDRAILSSTKEG